MFGRYAAEFDESMDRWVVRYGDHILRRSDGYPQIFHNAAEAHKAADRLNSMEDRYPMLAAIPERFAR